MIIKNHIVDRAIAARSVSDIRADLWAARPIDVKIAHCQHDIDQLRKAWEIIAGTLGDTDDIEIAVRKNIRALQVDISALRAQLAETHWDFNKAGDYAK